MYVSVNKMKGGVYSLPESVSNGQTDIVESQHIDSFLMDCLNISPYKNTVR